jgi:hypothetical protein
LVDLFDLKNVQTNLVQNVIRNLTVLDQIVSEEFERDLVFGALVEFLKAFYQLASGALGFLKGKVLYELDDFYLPGLIGVQD